MTRTFWVSLVSLTLLAGVSLAEGKIAVLDVVQVVNASECATRSPATSAKR